MRSMFMRLALIVADVVGWVWRLLPVRLREWLVTGLYVIESRGDSAQGLRRLFVLQDRLEWVINERAMAYGAGVHPKHWLTSYHDFFVDRIDPGARVLDIGCGHGVVARSIASRCLGSHVVGVELNKKHYERACAGDVPQNLQFVLADARNSLPTGPWNVVVLSNILEHIEDRVGFLRDIIRQAQPSKVLVRVPSFERDWKLPMRKELGIGYFSDSEHFIEHRRDELDFEMAMAGLRCVQVIMIWGEIWAECVPVTY